MATREVMDMTWEELVAEAVARAKAPYMCAVCRDTRIVDGEVCQTCLPGVFKRNIPEVLLK